jgi:valyl-tRNA synthetase
MSLDLPKSYDAKLVEGDVYRRWEDSGCFKAGAGAKPGAPRYSIAIPPPNVTGVLHMGHALNNALQDTLVRWRRMQGYDTLWQPGTDHAGIATEAVVAKQLQEEGTTRESLGREAFIQRVWRWKEQSGGAITKQLRKLGASCDWSRERFTMDEGLSKAVRTQFKNLYDTGLIYRGTRMVNWSPVLKTALSDDEVDHVEKQGHLWKLRYDIVPSGAPVVGRSGAPDDADVTGGDRYIVVETTRPETFFGDTAVAVNPADERYRHLIGRKVRLPIVGREIPIIGDEHADPAKGSGAVKITPAHDPNDYEVGLRHHLPLVRCIGFDGTMTTEAAHYAGQDRFACRKALVKELEASGVLLGSTEITHSVGHSERSKEPIEPMVTEQWFVKMAPLAERALAETRDGRVEFHPERWSKVYCHWLENVRDWCISRQIWWGHRIPAWYCGACGKVTVAIEAPSACAYCRSADLRQDDDVLDTWFSSALWPFSTLGWPDLSDPALERYFPTSTLVTDRGIIYFWVARMVMAGLFALGKRPFDDVYIHGTVLDERGVKMSKSLGNGIDPLVMIEGGTQRYLGKDYQCSGYGADALRYTLLDMTTEGQDLKLNPTKFETGRNFANKVWNAGRFLLMNLSERPFAQRVGASDVAQAELGFVERWLLDRLQRTVLDCTDALEKFRYNDYANAAYRFFRDDLCDWYVEWSKRQFKHGGPGADAAAKVLWYCFDVSLRLLHPGMPFITEYLWQQLQTTAGGEAWKPGQFLMTSAWPGPTWSAFGLSLADDGLQRRMAERQAVVTAIRNIRNQQQLADGVQLAAVIVAGSLPAAAALEADGDFVIDRANLSSLTIGVGLPKPPVSVSEVVGALRVHVPLTGVVDLPKLKDQITKRIAALEKSISGKQGRLGNADYIARAPAAQVEETRGMLAKEEAELVNLRDTLAGL